MIGLKRNTVKLVSHHESWEIHFRETKKELSDLIGEYVSDIQHVGSTSVKFIEAKPILDIAIAVKNLSSIKKIITILKKNGFEYQGDRGADGGHLFFRCSEPDIRTHHIHIVELNDPQWKNYLNFRDKLNGDKKLALKYSEIKKKLEKKFPDDRKKYTKAKIDFIRQVLQPKK